jgi:hydroxyacyl-ACP dehydratase HTD2-like protein with hotdog domain
MEVPGELRRWIGRESGPVQAAGPIEWSDVRRYVNATGDANPRWGAADLDRNPSRVGAFAPPAMILDVLRPGAGQDEIGDSGDRAFPSLAGLAGTISVPGEIARLNAGTEIEWLRPLRIGDWVTIRFKILDIQARATASGPAVFITEQRTYSDQRDEIIAVLRQVTVRRVEAKD